MNMKYDIAVIGGGPAGYSCAIRAAQRGAKVACIEKTQQWEKSIVRGGVLECWMYSF